MSNRPRSLCQIIRVPPLPVLKEDCKGSLGPEYQMSVPKFTNCKKEFPTRTKKVNNLK